jgi:fructoselysine and glucoselysine-specific PTS system IIA component
MNTKTRKFLIATHGALASGFRSSLELIAGAGDSVVLLEAYLDDSKPVDEELARLFARAGDGVGTGAGVRAADGVGAGTGAGVGAGADEEWVVFSDLLGGSITNQLVQAAVGKNVHIIAGFNLPLLIEMVLADPEEPISSILETAIDKAREQLVYVNPLINLKNDSENA